MTDFTSEQIKEIVQMATRLITEQEQRPEPKPEIDFKTTERDFLEPEQKFDFDTPAKEFPDVWEIGDDIGIEDVFSVGINNLINKHVFLGVQSYWTENVVACRIACLENSHAAILLDCQLSGVIALAVDIEAQVEYLEENFDDEPLEMIRLLTESLERCALKLRTLEKRRIEAAKPDEEEFRFMKDCLVVDATLDGPKEP